MYSGEFYDMLYVEQVSDSGEGLWKLTRSMRFHSLSLGMITVPRGFTTDFASVPRLPLVYLLHGDVAHRPAVVHDYMYSNPKFTRSQADTCLREAMFAVSIPAWRAWSMYFAVRLFGWVYKTNVTEK